VTLACWSSKGGSGTTVVAVAFARLLGEASPGGALLVDLTGDAAAVLGLPDDLGPGVADWLEVGAGVPADGLARIEHPVLPGLSLVARGAGRLVDLARTEVLAAVLGADPRPVVVDCGRVDADAVGTDVARTLAASATHSFLVIRPCYLALRRASAAGFRPSGVVVVREPGRSLGVSDIEDVLGVPVVAVIDHDARVSRAVDSGLFVGRIPVSLRRALRRVA
jgi:hypothetical protein